MSGPPYISSGTNSNVGIDSIPNLSINSNSLAITNPSGCYFNSPNLYCPPTQTFNFFSNKGFKFISGSSTNIIDNSGVIIDNSGVITCNGLNIINPNTDKNNIFLIDVSNMNITGNMVGTNLNTKMIGLNYTNAPTFTSGQIGYTFYKNTSDLGSTTIPVGSSNLYTISNIPIGLYMVTTQVTLSGVIASNVARICIKLNGTERSDTAVHGTTIVSSNNTLSIKYVLTNNVASGNIVITISMGSGTGTSTYVSGFLQICRTA
jgi:hypothetical protein